ncbi:MAG TPA: type II toxin-antitoxin system antitoxin SocA domain-containing protein, partial [Aestuariivirgaceae bacterium]|nr:type II toxin-antitoxin system antitoxin SocA domain-containing protein [Aestuariivirgaceae bacterium]
MTLDGRLIANLILDHFDSEEWAISNKKINKLIYFCHGFSLCRLSQPLVRNHFEAWRHGPVIKVVYDNFKKAEFSPIKIRATAFDYVEARELPVSYQAISSQMRDFILGITEHFIGESADELEQITHESGSPWHIV